MSIAANDPIVATRRCLQQALEVELFTIPPYLTALYSLREGSNLGCAQILQGVVMEEMLHMLLIANVLNAIDGRPHLDPQAACQDGLTLTRMLYPNTAPHISVTRSLRLRRFSRAVIEDFQWIEQPDPWLTVTAPPFTTIGEFYEYIAHALVAACDTFGESSVFCGNPNRQFSDARFYYGAGGRVFAVRTLSDALLALQVVAEQGEGRRLMTIQTGDQVRFGQPKEVAHHYRFTQILSGRYFEADDSIEVSPSGAVLPVDWSAVHPMRDDPFDDPNLPADARDILAKFIDTYATLLALLDTAFNGQHSALGDAIGTMHALRHQAVALMQVPVAGGSLTVGTPLWFVQSN